MSYDYTQSRLRWAPTDVSDWIEITPSSSSYGLSNWFELIHAAESDIVVSGVAIGKYSYNFVPNDWEIEIGIGDDGSEVVIGRSFGFAGFQPVGSNGVSGNTTFFWPIGINTVPQGSRVAARLRKQGTTTITWRIAIGYYRKPLLGSMSTTTGIPSCSTTGTASSTCNTGSTAWTNPASWSTVENAPYDLVIGGAALFQGNAAKEFEVDVGFGTAGNEIPLGTFRAISEGSKQGLIHFSPLPVALDGVSSGTRIAIRGRWSGGIATSIQVRLLYYPKPVGAPNRTTTALLKTAPAAADGLSLTLADEPAWGSFVQLLPNSGGRKQPIGLIAFASVNNIEIEIGAGPASSETAIGRWRCHGLSTRNGGSGIPWIVPVAADQLPPSTRVALRGRKPTGGSGSLFGISMQYYETLQSGANMIQAFHTNSHPATAAPTVPAPSSDWIFSDWVEVVAALTEDVLVTGFAIDFGQTEAEICRYEIEIGTGAQNFESTATAYRSSICSHEWSDPPLLPVAHLFTVGTRLSVRLRKSVTSVNNDWGVALLWYAQLPDSLGPSGPEPVFNNAELVIGETWIIPTFRSGRQTVWSDRPLPDRSIYYLGWKQERVMQWGRIRRALSRYDGQSESSDFTVLISDTDRLLRQLDADAELVNSTNAVYMIADPDRRRELTAFTIYRGVTRDAQPKPTLAYELTIKDMFAEQFAEKDPCPRRTVTTDDFANSNQTLVRSSAEGYVVDGIVVTGSPNTTTKIPVRDGWGVFAEGDRVTFGASNDIYSVVSMSSCFETPGIDTETYILVDPALLNDLADGDTVNVLPSHQIEAAAGKRVPFYYGTITDYKIVDGEDAGDGQGVAMYVGDKVLPDGKTYGEFLWASHACYSPSDRPIIQLYFWNESLDNFGNGIYFPSIGTLAEEADGGGRVVVPGYDNWAITNGFGTTTYRDYNGRRYTVFYMRGIFRDWALGITMAPVNLGGVPFAVNAYGIERVGNGTGSQITNGFEAYLHCVKNWIPPKGDPYDSGAWKDAPTFPDDPSLPMIDEPSFDAAQIQSQVYVPSSPGGFRLDFGVGVNNDAITARELIARFNTSLGCESGFNRNTQFFVNLVNTDLGTTDLSLPLTYVRDIFAGTFEIEPLTRELFTAIDYRHTQDYLNRAEGGWRSITTGVTEVENVNATARYGAKTTYTPYLMYMVRGKNRSTDPDEYQQGSDTAAAVLALKLARLSAIQHIVKLQTGPAGFHYELGNVFLLTHYEGLSATGWTDRPIRVERVEIDPSEFTTTLECYDLDPILGTLQ